MSPIEKERFDQAIKAVVNGEVSLLSQLIEQHPALLTARYESEEAPYSAYFHRPTLLHFVAGNPDPASYPANMLEVLRLLVEAGAEVDAVTDFEPYWSWTTLGLVASGNPAVNSGQAYELMAYLIKAGADINFKQGLNIFGAFFHTPSNQRLAALATWLVDQGGETDLAYASACGKLDLVKAFVTPDGQLTSTAYGRYRLPGNYFDQPTREALLAEALVYACLCGQQAVAAYLLELGADIQHPAPLHQERPTPLHAAVWGNWPTQAN
ncbi:MAG: hypothetical protein AAFP92_32210, partial [Bacteroidota bacterium]